VVTPQPGSGPLRLAVHTNRFTLAEKRMSGAVHVTYQADVVIHKRIEMPDGRVRQVAALVYRIKKISFKFS
jgi:hypothetical protein